MEDLTVVCWKWAGWNPIYGPADVHRLQSQCAKYLPPHRFVCITDDPTDLECETFPLWSFPEIDQSDRRRVMIDDIRTARAKAGKQPTDQEPLIPNCYLRLRLFDPEINREFGGHVLSMDLDCEIFDEFDPGRHSFKILRGFTRSPYCGSMFMLKAGEHREVWERFDPVASPKLLAKLQYQGRALVGSDQAWMGFAIPDAPTWSEADGIYQARQLMRTHRSKPPSDMRICFAAGRLKINSDACRLYVPWLYRRYNEST